MTQPSYNIKDVYSEIFTTNDYFGDDNGQFRVNTQHKSINDYCGSWRDSGKDDCHNYIQLAICGFIYLLKNFKKYILDYDKLVEYAILWLSYKLNEAPKECNIKLNEFYTKYIETNNHYNNIINDDDNMTYKNIINKKKDLMNMDINEISKFNALFYILFFSYYLSHLGYQDCKQFSLYPISFANNFNELNEDSNNIEGSLYTQILSTLSNDYKNLKNIYDDKDKSCKFPDLPKIEPKKNSGQNTLESSVEKSVKDSEQTLRQPSYNIKDVYSAINTIDGYFYEKNENGGSSLSVNESIHQYCNYENTTEDGKCQNYFEMASSGVIHLLEMLNDKFDSKYDKLAEYVILWLSYKLNRHLNYSGTNLNDFYTKYIETNDNYNIKINDNANDSPNYKDIINKNKDLMNTNEISKFNAPFSSLLLLYNGIKGNNLDCTKYSSYPKLFASEFENLNNDSNIIGNASFRKLLYILSDDYNNFKNKYGNDKSCDFPTLSPVKTSSSSSIASKLIPGLSAFAIPALFGIAYKTIYKKKIKKNKEENET
ncbi:PIR protein CIR protein [Plasmodium vinckei vinckei]|uniref:PIR protein CIR protein n=1 Tax=Plasmodium vinckei vinckei TaxID=54757 RepID=A0A449BMB4_PLAVN|nr:PIR protein CIR protein [Plasmodium vinckei vinckei]VEV54555.1 PIR protein CIR protein [Plasmodium vinckei vinckei]